MMEINEQDPLHPITLDDYPKLFDYVLTAKGLVYFQELKRKYFLGKNLLLMNITRLGCSMFTMLLPTEICPK
jgi:hypothetical protein